MVELPTQSQKADRKRKPDDEDTDDSNDEPAAPPSCLVERIVLPCDEIQSPILSLKLDREQVCLALIESGNFYNAIILMPKTSTMVI